MSRAGASGRVGVLIGALIVLPLACAMPLLDAEIEDNEDELDDDDELSSVREPVVELASQLRAASVEQTLARAKTSPPKTETDPDPETESANSEPEPEPEPSAEELAAMLDAGADAIVDLGVKIDPRARPRGPMPDGSGLRDAYAEGRALNLEGRLEQVREWAALAKFGSREPGVRYGSSPVSRYDLIVTRDPKHNTNTAWLHVVVPAAGLPDAGAGTHEAWVGKRRWVNLADTLEPGRDYLPFKTNGDESLHRQWAEAEVVASLASIAAEYRQRTGLPLGVGDLSHVTGGKIEDHWTHQKGVDVDLYLLDPAVTDDDDRPIVWWSHVARGVPIWTLEEKGKGERESPLAPDDELSHTPTSRRLEILASIVFLVDEVAYFVHNDPRVLDPFDRQVGERRPGRRFLHADNRGFWPRHCDHVHLRWVEGKLPVGVTPRP